MTATLACRTCNKGFAEQWLHGQSQSCGPALLAATQPILLLQAALPTLDPASLLPHPCCCRAAQTFMQTLEQARSNGALGPATLTVMGRMCSLFGLGLLEAGAGDLLEAGWLTGEGICLVGGQGRLWLQQGGVVRGTRQAQVWHKRAMASFEAVSRVHACLLEACCRGVCCSI